MSCTKSEALRVPFDMAGCLQGPGGTSAAARAAAPGSPDTEAERRDVQAAAQAIGQQLIILDVTSEREIESAFAVLMQRRAGALVAGTGAFNTSHRERIVALT